ncbi:NAD(P)/FAD-dependent oxidoreductase [Reyranella soli]|uniref:FAD-dependent oxidoreductase n=1 Tax=Reyranella soli TaxID=1230389 RepID=A0A512NCV7_9HYPH|nr:FAD-binding oxidoreductase [Reyranella soli]GEP56788.1 FAD-dependent oxidoreductase [Reyranella soli]
MAEPFPLEPSLWAATAPAAPATPALGESVTADVCIVGGGYCGLSTALHLAERGIKAVVLEAKEPGFGGSGRNGGQVIPGLKFDPDELETMFGPERGPALVDFASRTADVVWELIDKHRMDVPNTRNGWIQSAHAADMVGTLKSRVAQWERRGAPVALLDKAETEQHIGTDQYLCSWIDRRGGVVQPLAYARGLARAALAAGAAIHGRTPATALARDGGKWVVSTAGGPTVTADRVVLATNGYTGDLWPRLRQTIIAANSFQIATKPLSDNVRKSILPGGQATSDSRRVVLYYRLDHTGRFLLGGRGPMREPDGPQDWDHLEAMMGRVFPQLKGVAIDYRWGGRVAATRDHLPHLHEPAPGLLIDIGCMGRGVALQSAMGRAMAAYIASGDPAALPLPPTAIKPLPFHGLNKLYLAAFITWYRFLDQRGIGVAA